MTPLAHRILDVVDMIPAGCVASYGQVADVAGARSPRIVGTVLSRYGDEVPWHRVVRSDGTLPAGLTVEASALLRAEGVPLDEGGRRVLIDHCRWSGPPGQ